MPVRRPRPLLLLPALCALVATTLAVPAQASPGSGEEASGPGWTVDRVPGGYEVTVELEAPLPVRGDAPTIVVDGETLGLATRGGRLPVPLGRHHRPRRAPRRRGRAGWASESAPGRRPAAARSRRPRPPCAELAADPGALGDQTWTESIYTFGEQSVELAAIGGVRGELEGKIYLPATGGPRPTVLLMHGRHTSCYGAGAANPARWPCATSPEASPARLSIPSYLGYDGTARALASHGYAVVSVSANAINSNDNQLAADQGAQARGQLLLDTLTMLDGRHQGEAGLYYDAWQDRDVSLDQALVDGTAALAERADGFVGGVEPLDTVTAADLRGRFDLSKIGMMGHSRGGEGVTSAAVLNQALANPWAIELDPAARAGRLRPDDRAGRADERRPALLRRRRVQPAGPAHARRLAVRLRRRRAPQRRLDDGRQPQLLQHRLDAREVPVQRQRRLGHRGPPGGADLRHRPLRRGHVDPAEPAGAVRRRHRVHGRPGSA